MARNNITTYIINNDVPSLSDPVAEPIFLFRASSKEMFLQKQTITQKPDKNTLTFIVEGDLTSREVILKDKNSERYSFQKSSKVTLKKGEYSLSYDKDQKKTTLTFGFESGDEILSLQELSLFSLSPFDLKLLTITQKSYEKAFDESSLNPQEVSELKSHFSAFFNISGGLTYAKVYLFSDFQDIKSLQKSLRNFEIVALNISSKDLDLFYDKSFRYWFSYQNETKEEIQKIAETYVNNSNLGNVVMCQSEDLFLVKFISKYFKRVESFIASSPMAFSLSGATVISEEERKTFYRDNKILFYTFINEDYKDLEKQVKDGLGLDGNEIDKVTTLNWIRGQSDKTLINIYQGSGGNNAKIDALESSGKRPSVYSAALVNFFDSLVKQRLIVGYVIEDFRVDQTQELNVTFNSQITYNKSIVSLTHNITNNPPVWN